MCSPEGGTPGDILEGFTWRHIGALQYCAREVGPDGYLHGMRTFLWKARGDMPDWGPDWNEVYWWLGQHGYLDISDNYGHLIIKNTEKGRATLEAVSYRYDTWWWAALKAQENEDLANVGW